MLTRACVVIVLSCVCGKNTIEIGVRTATLGVSGQSPNHFKILTLIDLHRKKYEEKAPLSIKVAKTIKKQTRNMKKRILMKLLCKSNQIVYQIIAVVCLVSISFTHEFIIEDNSIEHHTTAHYFNRTRQSRCKCARYRSQRSIDGQR